MEEKNRLYDQFDTKKVNELTADNLDSFRDQIFIEESNEKISNDLIRSGILSNQLSVAGPIPGTGRIESVSRTSDGTDTIFRPSIGEVWQFIAGDCTAVGGGVRFKFQLYDGSTTIEIKDQSVSSSTDPVDLTTVPLILDRNVYLRVNISSISTGESGTVNCAFIRIR
jgi:hypothetical protein